MNPSDWVDDLMEVTWLYTVFDIADDEPTAVKALTERPRPARCRKFRDFRYPSEETHSQTGSSFALERREWGRGCSVPSTEEQAGQPDGAVVVWR